MTKPSMIIVLSLLMTGTAMSALTVNKQKVNTSCKDVRVAMDGGYYANVEVGGLLTKHTSVIIYKRSGTQKLKLGSFDVNPHQTKSADGIQENYVGKNVKFTVLPTKNPKNEYPGVLTADLGGEKITANLYCARR